MTAEETRAILTIALLAAFADGQKHERERDEIRRIAEGLSSDDAVRLPALYQDVLMQRVSLADTLPALATAPARQLAYEMAVCVCDADGAKSPAEQAFLAQLQQGLGLDAHSADGFSRQSQELVVLPAAAAASAGAAGATSGAPAAAPAPVVDQAALDKDILDTAILNGALELLPETLSTMAIIPLQMKLVYRIGQAHGYALDSGHIKDFIATAGVGLTSQYLEQAGRKLLGGLLGRIGGGLVGGLGRQAVSSGMSFASTYALGQLATRYYAGGRTLSTQVLKDSYGAIVQQAQGLYQNHLPAIQEKARGLNVGQVLAMVRGR